MEKEAKKKDNLILVLAILIVMGFFIFGLGWYLATKKGAPLVPQPSIEFEDDSSQKILEDLDKIKTEPETLEEDFKALDENIRAL